MLALLEVADVLLLSVKTLFDLVADLSPATLEFATLAVLVPVVLLDVVVPLFTPALVPLASIDEPIAEVAVLPLTLLETPDPVVVLLPYL